MLHQLGLEAQHADRLVGFELWPAPVQVADVVEDAWVALRAEARPRVAEESFDSALF